MEATTADGRGARGERDAGSGREADREADLGGRRTDGGPVLRGPRLLLRPVTPLDERRLMDILAEPSVVRWWLRTEWERLLGPPGTQFVIEVPGESAPHLLRTVGFIQFSEEQDPDYRFAAVDLFLASEAQGRGLGAEALRVLLRHLIDDAGMRRFTIDPAVENEAAIGCYRRVGFRPVGVMRAYERVGPGRYRDGLLMDLLADEFVEQDQDDTAGSGDVGGA